MRQGETGDRAQKGAFAALKAGLAALTLAAAFPAWAQTPPGGGAANPIQTAPAASSRAATLPAPAPGSIRAAQNPVDDPAAPALRGSAAAAPDPASPINYGKPRRAVRVLPKRLGQPNARPLPPLQPYRTAPGLRRPVQPGAVAETPGPTVAAIPALPQPRRPLVDPRPYDPVGLDVGGLRLTPFVESDIGYDSSPERTTATRRGSFFSRVEGGGALRSDWSRHEFDATLRGGYSEFFTARDASRPDVQAIANGRLDVNRDLTVDAQGRFALDSQRASSPGLLAGTNLSSRPLIYSYGGNLGATQRIGRLSLGLRGTADRFTYDDANVAGGANIALSRQNYNDFALRGRVGYEVTPGITPFVDATIDARRYDSRIDASGFARSSDGYTVRAGSTFELTRTLTGEAAAGYSTRRYADARLRDLSSPIFDASLVWTASPLTTVTLRGVGDLQEASVVNASGAVTRRISLELAHSLLRNLTFTGTAAYQTTDYQGASQHEENLILGVRAEYNLTRSVVIRSSFTHDRLKSNVPGSDYTANTVLLGLRLQQ